MNITSYQAGDSLVLSVEDSRIDAAVAIEFKEAVMCETSHTSGSPVLLEMSNVVFLDSSGLGAVVAAMKLLGQDRPLQLVGLTDPVAKVFRLTRMDSIFTIHPSLPDELRAAG